MKFPQKVSLTYMIAYSIIIIICTNNNVLEQNMAFSDTIYCRILIYFVKILVHFFNLHVLLRNWNCLNGGRESTILLPNINNFFMIVTKSLCLPSKPSKQTADKIKKKLCKSQQTADKM